MTIHLDHITIDPKWVNHFKRIGSKVCILGFITGESITVACGVKTPDHNTITFSGTPEDLKELLSEYIEANELSERRTNKRKNRPLTTASSYHTA